MFCPNCGQRQISNEARFCAACGFPLNVVGELLANGGQLPWRPTQNTGQPSPRTRGIKQGAFLMLSTLVVVPIVIFLGVALLRMPGELIPLVGSICVMGGLLRMLYALFFESNVPGGAPPAPGYAPPPSYSPNYLGAQPQRPAPLPPPQGTPVPAAYQRPPRYNTGELAEPPRTSITDHTTRLLDKQPDEPPRQ